ncbi:hypothetical protein ZIOFF_044448 [Zingiber officinale]|uniref:NAD-dependent epimerase/dehydratase domain-containing protein n=1 Tax=Zingiber officinale TaxID=94328 RepID=A0A8J5FV82_ZINOF|nr:hypothetical protein ZIOFF_044448 [Zingiber officinale]
MTTQATASLEKLRQRFEHREERHRLIEKKKKKRGSENEIDSFAFDPLALFLPPFTVLWRLNDTCSARLLRYERSISTESNHVDEPHKLEEVETIRTPPPPLEKLLVLGGNGFIGSHVCKEALDQGLSVSSLSRSGRSSIREQWADKVEWRQGSLLVPETWRDALNDVTAVVRLFFSP